MVDEKSNADIQKNCCGHDHTGLQKKFQSIDLDSHDYNMYMKIESSFLTVNWE